MKWGPLRRGPHSPRGRRRGRLGLERAALALAVAVHAGCLEPDPARAPARPSPARDRVPATAPAARGDGTDVTVKRVIDGDTVLVTGLPEGSGLIRLIGVNAPETGAGRTTRECFGADARRWLAERAPAGARIRLVEDVGERDRFGRRLAYVYAADGTFLNAALVETGHARTMTIRPNVRHAKELQNLERAARSDGRGLWSACRDQMR